MDNISQRPTWRKFHDDETGMEPLYVVMLVAIAAAILIAFRGVIGMILQFCYRKVQELIGGF